MHGRRASPARNRSSGAVSVSINAGVNDANNNNAPHTIMPDVLYSCRKEMPITFATQIPRRLHDLSYGVNPLGVVHGRDTSATQQEHAVPKCRPTAVMENLQPAAAAAAAAPQQWKTVPKDCDASARESERITTVETQTCPTLAMMAFYSKETQTEHADADRVASRYHLTFSNVQHVASTLSHGREVSQPPSPTPLGSPHTGGGGVAEQQRNAAASSRGGLSVVPSASELAATGVHNEDSLLQTMNSVHTSNRENILVSDMIARENRLLALISKQQQDFAKELVAEKERADRNETAATRSSDFLRTERLQHETQMNDLRVALEVAKQATEEALKERLLTQEELVRQKRINEAQEAANVKNSKDQSKRIVQAMEKHLVRQYDESEQRNANRVAEEQRRYKERREEWMRTMKLHQLQPDAIAAAAGGSGTFGDTIQHSRSQQGTPGGTIHSPSMISSTGSVSTSPRLSLLRMSETAMDDGIRGNSPFAALRSPSRVSLSSDDSTRATTGPSRSTPTSGGNTRSGSKTTAKPSARRVVNAQRVSESRNTNGTSRFSSSTTSATFTTTLPGKTIQPPPAMRSIQDARNEKESLFSLLPTSPAKRALSATAPLVDYIPPSVFGQASMSLQHSESDAAANGSQTESSSFNGSTSERKAVPAQQPAHQTIEEDEDHQNAVQQRMGDERTMRKVSFPDGDGEVSVSMPVPPTDVEVHGSRPPRMAQRSSSMASSEALGVLKGLTMQASQQRGRNETDKASASTPSKSWHSTTTTLDPEVTNDHAMQSRREFAIHQLESALTDVEKLTSLLRERSAGDVVVDAEKRVQDCAATLKAMYEKQHQAVLDKAKLREREVAELFTVKTSVLERELNSMSDVVRSLHEKIAKLEVDNEHQQHRAEKAERTHTSQIAQLSELRCALLRLEEDRLCCLCRNVVLREELVSGKSGNTAATEPSSSQPNLRPTMQITAATVQPRPPSAKQHPATPAAKHSRAATRHDIAAKINSVDIGIDIENTQMVHVSSSLVESQRQQRPASSSSQRRLHPSIQILSDAIAAEAAAKNELSSVKNL